MATAKKPAAPKKTGTALAVKTPTLPANIDEAMANEIASFQSRLSAPSGKRIKATRRGFELPDGSIVDSLQAIIVDFVSFNAYYDTEYDQDQVTPPACFAISVDPTGMEPSENCKDKQCESCSACWANQWKSAPRGNGKACTNSKLLALLPPDGNMETDLMVLKVSPTGIKSFDGYAANVARVFGRPPYGVVTDITLDQSVDYPSVRFGEPEPCSREQLALAFARKEDAFKLLTTEPDYSAAEAEAAAKPAAKGKGQLQKPAGARRKAA